MAGCESSADHGPDLHTGCVQVFWEVDLDPWQAGDIDATHWPMASKALHSGGRPLVLPIKGQGGAHFAEERFDTPAFELQEADALAPRFLCGQRFTNASELALREDDLHVLCFGPRP